MARAPAVTDFTITVPNIGTFTFGRRRMADEIAIQTEFARMIDGTKPTPWLETVAGWTSVLMVLTVRAPGGWNIDDLDPLDPTTYDKMHKVYEALREQERSFRGGSAVASEGSGEAKV